MYSELFGKSVPTSQECDHKSSEIYLVQSWRYPYICQIIVGKYAHNQTRNIPKKIKRDILSRTGDIAKFV